MEYLVDTHAIIRFISNNKRLPEVIRKTIINNKCFASIATFWELGIKYSLKRIELKAELNEIFKIIEQSGFEILPVTQSHILASTKLEFLHNDPFDRLLIGQANTENLTLITKDEEIKKYNVLSYW